MTLNPGASKGPRNPFSIYDLDPKRGEPGPRNGPTGTPGLAAWFAGRMQTRQ